jgi:hypothetical protein
VPFFDTRHSITTAAQAAGLKPDTVSKWIRRGELVMRPEDREQRGRGGGVILSAHTAVQLILAGELTRRGMTVPDACEAALTFAHEGDIAGEMGAKHCRAPGCLFPAGQITLLVINRARPELSKVQAFDPDTALQNMRTRLDAIDVETLLMMRLGFLGVDVHAAMKEIRGE